MSPSPQPTSYHQNSLDGVRAVAALLVVVLHVSGATGLAARPEPFALLVGHGDSGVAIFFVLSGLLLYRPWATALFSGDARPATVPYLWRRFWRVVPAYWLTVVVGMLAFNYAHTDRVWPWVELLGMIHNYDPNPWWNGTGPVGLYHLWTIPVEMSFYLVLPLLGALVGVFAKRAADPSGRARRALLAISMLWPVNLAYQYLAFHPEWRPEMGTYLPRSLLWFALGMSLAVLLAWSQAHPTGPGRRLCVTVGSSLAECWIAAGLIYIVASTEVTGPWGLNFGFDSFWTSTIKIVLYGAGSALFIAPLALHPGNRHPLAEFFGNRMMRWLGRISYGIYLWHAILLLILERVLGSRIYTTPYLLVLAVTLLVTLPAAALSHRVVEEPVRRFGTRLTVRRRPDKGGDDRAAEKLRDRIAQNGALQDVARGRDHAGQAQ